MIQVFKYPNTIWGANPNTEYQILFGIEKIRIPHTNTTIWSNYSNSIEIPNSLFIKIISIYLVIASKILINSIEWASNIACTFIDVANNVDQ